MAKISFPELFEFEFDPKEFKAPKVDGNVPEGPENTANPNRRRSVLPPLSAGINDAQGFQNFSVGADDALGGAFIPPIKPPDEEDFDTKAAAAQKRAEAIERQQEARATQEQKPILGPVQPPVDLDGQQPGQPQDGGFITPEEQAAIADPFLSGGLGGPGPSQQTVPPGDVPAEELLSILLLDIEAGNFPNTEAAQRLLSLSVPIPEGAFLDSRQGMFVPDPIFGGDVDPVIRDEQIFEANKLLAIKQAAQDVTSQTWANANRLNSISLTAYTQTLRTFMENKFASSEEQQASMVKLASLRRQIQTEDLQAQDAALQTEIPEFFRDRFPTLPDGSLDFNGIAREFPGEALQLRDQQVSQIMQMSPDDPNRIIKASSLRSIIEKAFPLPGNIRFQDGEFTDVIEGRIRSEEVGQYLNLVKDQYMHIETLNTVVQRSANFQEAEAQARATMDIEAERLRQDLLTDKIDSAEEAEIRREEAEIEALQAASKNRMTEILMSALQNPFTFASALHTGFFQQIAEQLGLSLNLPGAGVPTDNPDGIPGIQEWQQMTFMQRNMALVEWLSANPGMTQQDFVKKFSSQVPGAAQAPTEVRFL